jgi:RNA polymerase-binding protein DksA
LPGRTNRTARGKTKSASKPSGGRKEKPTKKATGKAAGQAGKKAARKTAKKAAKPKRQSLRPRGASRKSPAGQAKNPKMATPGKATQSRVMQSKARVEELRAMLEAKRAEIVDEIKRAREDSMTTDQTSFPEVGDLVSASVEKERAFEYGEAGVHALREINAALEKLKAGTYGICEICSRAIGIKRLKVMPSARLCIKCKSKEEASAGVPPGR